jgi:DNA invertase Pin-like site-specific DNA recombinase
MKYPVQKRKRDNTDDNATSEKHKNVDEHDVKKKKTDSDLYEICKSFARKNINWNGSAVLYARVSTNNQVDGTSLESQLQLSRKYCSDRKFKIIGEQIEVCSAKTMATQYVLQSILEYNNDVKLIVLDPSRLSRNVKDFIVFCDSCKNKNIEIHFVQNNLVATNTHDFKKILSGVIDSETEIINLSARIKHSVEFRKNNGKYYSSIAKYGYQYNKKTINNKITTVIEVNKQEQNIILLINKLFWGASIETLNSLLLQLTGTTHKLFNTKDPTEQINSIEYGNMLYVDIARFLNSIPLLHRNKKWTPSFISRLITCVSDF